MQVKLQMVGHHRTDTINIKNIQFTNGVATVTGGDEFVGNICKYLEGYGAWPLHLADQKQAEIDGEGDLLGIRAAKRKLEKADQMRVEGEKEILRAQDAVEARLQLEATQEKEAASLAALAAQERQAVAEEKARALNGEVEDKSTTEGRGSKPSSDSKGSKSRPKNG